MSTSNRFAGSGKNTLMTMERASNRSIPTRIAVVGNHLPRQCGIATFTTDLCNAIAAEYRSSELSVVAINDPQSPSLKEISHPIARQPVILTPEILISFVCNTNTGFMGEEPEAMFWNC